MRARNGYDMSDEMLDWLKDQRDKWARVGSLDVLMRYDAADGGPTPPGPKSMIALLDALIALREAALAVAQGDFNAMLALVPDGVRQGALYFKVGGDFETTRDCATDAHHIYPARETMVGRVLESALAIDPRPR